MQLNIYLQLQISIKLLLHIFFFLYFILRLESLLLRSYRLLPILHFKITFFSFQHLSFRVGTKTARTTKIVKQPSQTQEPQRQQQQ